MTQPSETRSVTFHEARGTLPARIWKDLREAERSADGDIPIAVLREGKADSPWLIYAIGTT
jgi:hypothetical protein